MDTVVDVVPAGETVIAVKADPTAPVDLLGRQEIVDRIMKILEVISEKRTSCTFALNGAWGTGKTFVLNMLMNQLWEYHSDKYIVFHYNCWQYDYYEEPLIAIVAAMLDSVDEENHLLPENLRDKAKAGMELAKPVLKKIATNFVKNKIGVDLTDVVSTANSFKEAVDSEEKKRAEVYSFDEFYSFKKAIQQAQKEISKLTEDKTLVVVVDELDRCLPAYAIKVLERLHHLFTRLENTSVILAIDEDQISTTIKQIFGEKTDTAKYLRKFINFKMPLDVGQISANLHDKYKEYFDFFDESLLQTDFDFDKFATSLLSDIDVRTQEKIIGRIKTVHEMLFPSQKKDYSFLCCELIWAVFQEIYGGCSVTPPYRQLQDDIATITSASNVSIKTVNKELFYYLESVWSAPMVSLEPLTEGRYNTYMLHGSGVIQKLLLYYISHLQKNHNNRYCLSTDEALGMNAIWPIAFIDMAGEKIDELSPISRRNLLELMSVVELLDIIQ